jgi:thiol-disulfide isomerase/thioredoxin
MLSKKKWTRKNNAMHPDKIYREVIHLCARSWVGLWLLFLLSAGASAATSIDTLGSRYPGLSSGLLKSAVLTQLDNDTVLTADGVTIKRSQLSEGIRNQEPKLRDQLEKNLLFVLEQEAVRQILLSEAQKAGIAVSGGNDSQAIQSLFEHQTQALSVPQDEVRGFYEANKEMVAGAPFDQVEEGIRQYLLQDKKQQAVAKYIDNLGNAVDLRIDRQWVQEQSLLAADNPVDRARRSGKPTVVEFGAAGCVPCDMMQPILEKLRKDFPEKLNVVFVHVGEEQILAARYGIRSIPVQVFYDAKGQEVFRHVGFFAEKDVVDQLKKAGL